MKLSELIYYLIALLLILAFMVGVVFGAILLFNTMIGLGMSALSSCIFVGVLFVCVALGLLIIKIADYL